MTDRYFDSQALGRSDLRGIYLDPETWFGRRMDAIPPVSPTPAMVFGSALDFYLCNGKGPDPIPSDVFVIPFDSRRTKAAKEMIEQHSDMTCITETEAEKLRGESQKQLDTLMMCEKQVRDCPKAAALLFGDNTSHQHELYWTDESGTDLKSLPDVVKEGAAIVDLKTTADVDERSFLRKVDQLWYDCQASMMQDGYEFATGERLPVVFVVVRNVAPHNVELYSAPDWLLQSGRAKMRAAIARYQECNESGIWRSKSHNRIVTPEQPRWWSTMDYSPGLEAVR